MHDISSHSELKNGLFLQMVFIKFQLLKSWLYFYQIKVVYLNSISNYGIIRRTATKTAVVIYKVMYMEHCEINLRIEATKRINKESHIDFGVCAPAGCTNFIILHNYFEKIF